jgi:serine/threonine protein kinase
MDDIPSDFLASGSLDSAVRGLRGDLVGRQIGVYHVTALLGIGGMGEVYRARDTKLGRDIAVKVLPFQFTIDPERSARFEREARVLATLNHPHIGAIYGFEETNGISALILELIEGETLSERLTGGPLPISEALSVARQIAEALEAAHEKGIIHRDLKPANIKITSTETVKVLDFGLAKAVTRTGSGPDLSDAPDVTDEGTRTGTIVGTVAYMSPEQARGQTVDNRTDIWAFGCVLYEMLAGRPAFAAETVSDTIAAVIRGEPDWQRLPSALPAAVRTLLRRCLEKDPMWRLRDIGDVRIEINDALTQRGSAHEPSERRSNRRVMYLGVALLLASAAAGSVIASRFLTRQQTEPFQLTIETPPMPLPHSMAVSPDGRMVVFSAVPKANEPPILLLRRIGSLDFTAITGSQNGLLPFWSPDSRSIAFWDAASKELKVVDEISSRPRVICNTSSEGFQGGTWNNDGVVVFSMPTNSGGALFRVSALGGEPTPLVQPGPLSGVGLTWPQFLPDGNRFLYLAAGGTGNEAARAIFVASLNGGNPVRLTSAESNAVFVEPDLLLFTKQRVLVARRFDQRTLRFTGDPTPVARDVVVQANGRAAFATSLAGVLIYRTGRDDRALVWVDRKGRVGESVGLLSARNNVALSPDGNRVAFHEPSVPMAGDDIFIYDIERRVTTRLTTDPGTDHQPVWAPDGSSVAFDVHRENDWSVYARDAAGAKPEWQMVGPEREVGFSPVAWSSKYFVFWKGPREMSSASGRGDLWVQPLTPKREPFVYATRWAGNHAALSPNGRWIAYTSTSEGMKQQIVVQSFPDPRIGRHVISNNGVRPRWSPNGDELLYLRLGDDFRLIAVSVRTDGLFTIGRSSELFVAPSNVYDVAPDGQRFLFNVASTAVGSVVPITVVLNWMSGLKNDN